jgi:hypothetical protein
VGLVLIAACSGDEPVAVELGLGCTIDSDCQAPLACVFSRCHAQCSASRDCPSDERCVLGRGETHVCQLPDERDCAYNSDCPAGQLCSVDGQCRDECLVDRDCVSEQRCVSHTCADSDELVDGG